MEKSQTQRVLDLLLKKGSITSLELSQMHPVILNFHNALYELRQFHDIETKSELVKRWFRKPVKHTTYIYHGRRVIPERICTKKKYTKDDIIKAFNAGLMLEAPNAEAYLETL